MVDVICRLMGIMIIPAATLTQTWRNWQVCKHCGHRLGKLWTNFLKFIPINVHNFLLQYTKIHFCLKISHIYEILFRIFLFAKDILEFVDFLQPGKFPCLSVRCSWFCCVSSMKTFWLIFSIWLVSFPLPLPLIRYLYTELTSYNNNFMSTDVIENIHVWTADQLNTKISHDHLLRTTNILYQREVIGKGSKKIFTEIFI